MDMMKLRFVLAVTALLAIAGGFALVLFYGQTLTTVQVAVLSPLAMALIAEAKSSSAFIFDGVPQKADDALATPPAQ